MAMRLRAHSARVVGVKTAQELEPDRGAVADLFRSGIDTVVCGHFHRWHDEVFAASEGGGRFVILEPFEERGFFLSYNGREWGRRWISPEVTDED